MALAGIIIIFTSLHLAITIKRLNKQSILITQQYDKLQQNLSSVLQTHQMALNQTVHLGQQNILEKMSQGQLDSL